jgi:hypothetical protein
MGGWCDPGYQAGPRSKDLQEYGYEYRRLAEDSEEGQGTHRAVKPMTVVVVMMMMMMMTTTMTIPSLIRA